MPTLYPGSRPSTATSTIRPSASWPTALRGARRPSWFDVKASPARNTGAPSRTICGPPPTAATIPGQSGRSVRVTVTVAPTGAPARSADAAAPRASSTAPPGGIGTALDPERSSCTGAWSPIEGTVSGNGKRTAATLPATAGVVGPYAAVNSAALPSFGAALSVLIGLPPSPPSHVPAKATRRTSSDPSVVMPALARLPLGGLINSPSCITTPDGRPVARAK